ncbi:WS/DGAT/MGAT family O-acyltransferase [Parahaliea mediterranea]|uniref:diacylglycerol O-acyltransferase n=1 Tax=Parahaliea mediterranea TaxID=651086 RepID=A0A939DDM1_9GAMM|nr:wax ester/triacylglycerol synthase family O-acyltransferase [Parahaliea mediterranea]MBN7796298.1 wax ester/triacylglycerol synthase family O-acyltransferase [Parahaliea mediterranea]
MKQLGVLDAAFINLEQANTPQHIGGLGLYDPSTAPGGQVRFKQVIATFERRLRLNPLFRTRLVKVPGGIDRPYWVKDANFDVEFHLRHIALPQPGDWRQLCIQVARLHARPLDMNRPLWEVYVIEGLDNIPNLPAGCFAIYTKLHHALVDGAGGSDVLALTHDREPNPPQEVRSEQPLLSDTPPTVPELLSKATVNGLRNSLGFSRAALVNGASLARYGAGLLRGKVPLPELSAPRTRFNGPVGPHRVFEAAEFPLQEFKRIKDFAGVKVNDVAMAVIAGAMRQYLEQKGELPEGSLTATLPLNMRTRRGGSDDHNQVGAVFTSLHSDTPDPLERLAAIGASTRNAKTWGEQTPLVDIIRLAGAVSPVIAESAAGLWSHYELSRYLPANVSTVISNVAGPPFPLYCAGAQMVDYYGLGVLTPGVGIFHLVFSYADKVTLSVLADREILPDPQLYRQCLERTFDELSRGARPARKTRARRKASPARRKTRARA